MKEVEFNLLDEPWVRVLCADCTVREVSLTEALLHAHEYKGLAGELPTQDVAVLRLLLAVLHTVFWDHDANGMAAPLTDTNTALVRWRGLWRQGQFPEQPIRDYLAAWHERFWLFHPERPFWQAPDAKKGTDFGAKKLNGEIVEGEHKIRLFSSYSAEGKEELSYAQAARWLVYTNGFDDTAAKPKIKVLPNGEKPKSMKEGWLGRLGLVLAKGDTLFETLMLNLVLLEDGEKAWRQPRPYWEQSNPNYGERNEIPVPDNAAELLTLQSRRIILKREGQKVVSYSLLGGDFFESQNAFCEQMTVWEKQTDKKSGVVSFEPKKHKSAIQFWREFPTVFQSQEKNPGIVQWIVKLQTARILDRNRMIRFKIVGMRYDGTSSHTVEDTFSDSLTFHAALLDELGRKWRQKIADEIGRCEKLADAVGNLARNLDIAASDPDHASKKNSAKAAQEQFYFRLDQPFRRWLCDIDPAWDGETAEEYVRQWRADAKRISQTLGRQLVDQSGSAAFVGRMVKSSSSKAGDKETYYSAPKVYNWFLADVNRVYQK